MKTYRASDSSNAGKLFNEDYLLTGADNYVGWASELKSLTLSKGCWDFITGDAQRQLVSLRQANVIAQDKFLEELRLGNSEALGYIRRTISTTLMHLVDKCTAPIEAFEVLEKYCSKENTRSDTKLTADLTGLKMTMNEGRVTFTKRFNELSERLEKAGIILPERFMKSILI